MSKPSRKIRTVFAQLDALYAELPTIVCQGHCHTACGPIVLTDGEARRLQLVTHRAPRTTPEERCIYLSPQHRCTVYAVRPLICRAWGLVRALSCQFGCLPDRWLKDQEFLRIAQAIERLAGGRQLRTSPDGLVYYEGESFASIGSPRRSAAAIEANAERTRSLRALHGGRILAAVDETLE